MEETQVNFFFNDHVPWEELGDGIRRKIIGHTPHLMSVLIEFDKGAIGTPHSHDEHDQIAFVLKGSFEANINGEVRILKEGDSFVAPRNHLHGVIALEDKSRLIDQFSPRREDYLTAK